MARKDEIKNRLFEISTSNFNPVVDYSAYRAGYIDGINWADEHPAEETIKQVVELYKKWYSEQLDCSVTGFIRENWQRSEPTPDVS